MLTFGPIRQIAYVTRSMEQSMAYYTEHFGIGPWFMTERSVFQECRYRGEPCAMHLSAALASWGPLQLELMQQLDDAPSVFRGWQQRPFARELFHHVAHWTQDYAGAIASAAARGFVVEQDGTTPWGPFAYLSHPANPDHFIEFTEATPRRAAFNQAIADAAIGWDGQRPVRPFAEAVAAAEPAA